MFSVKKRLSPFNNRHSSHDLSQALEKEKKKKASGKESFVSFVLLPEKD